MRYSGENLTDATLTSEYVRQAEWAVIKRNNNSFFIPEECGASERLNEFDLRFVWDISVHIFYEIMRGVSIVE